MIEIKKFSPLHLQNFKSDDDLPDLYDSMLMNFKDPTKDILTLFRDGEVVAFTGVNHLRAGVGEVWIIRGELIHKYKFEFYKTILNLISYIQEFMELHRIELAVNCNWKEGDKWARSIGFEFESICRAYDHEYNDHAIYTRIKKRSI